MNRPTIKQAKKDNWMNLVYMLIGSVIFLVLFFVIQSDWKYAALFVSVCGLFYGFYSLFKGFRQIKRSFCPKCDTWYDYDNYDIKWKTRDVRKVGSKAYCVVDFICICPKCGQEIRYTKDLLVGTYNKDFNKWEEKDIYEVAKDLFWH